MSEVYFANEAATRAQSGKFMSGAALAAGDAPPISPIQTQLQRKRELLTDLEHAANNLIEPLKPVLTRDPRESKAAVPTPGHPSSCELEAILMGENERVADVIDRLREIRSAIRL